MVWQGELKVMVRIGVRVKAKHVMVGGLKVRD